MASSGTVKTENSRKRPAPTAEDREFERWAQELASKPIAPVPVANVLGNKPELPACEGFDLDSAIGKFGWFKIDDGKYAPVLFRNKRKYVCLKVVEAAIKPYLTAIPAELYESAPLKSHVATAAEAKTLNLINNWHCDNKLGPGADFFGEKDLMVPLDEVEQFWTFLKFAFSVLSSFGENKSSDFSRCGFVQVNNENLIPYTSLTSYPGEKGLPFFYFEGQVALLETKAQALSGWDLAYLKVCCKVQGVKKDLMHGSELKIVKLTDLKTYFPRRTVFTEEQWPKPKSKPLLPKSVLATFYSSNTEAPKSTAPPKSVPNKPVSSSPSLYPTPPLTPGERIATTISTTNPTTIVHGPESVVNNVQAPPLPVSVVNPFRRELSININGVQPNRVTNPLPQVAQVVNGFKLKANGPPSDFSHLQTIEEFVDGCYTGAYKVERVKMKSCNTDMLVINHRPFKSDHLVLLPAFVQMVCKSLTNVGLPVYPLAVEVLHQLKVQVYLPNSTQLKALNNLGFDVKRTWEMPLANFGDINHNYNQIRTLFHQFLHHQLNAHGATNGRTVQNSVSPLPVLGALGNTAYTLVNLAATRR